MASSRAICIILHDGEAHSSSTSSAIVEEKIANIEKIHVHYSRLVIISDNTKSANSLFSFAARGRVETGSERRWMSDRKLLWSCHERAPTMRATHPSSRNSNGMSADCELVGGKSNSRAAIKSLLVST